jgi:hypothetical protein
MTMIAAHLSVEALRARYVSSADVCEARHFQAVQVFFCKFREGDFSVVVITLSG